MLTTMSGCSDIPTTCECGRGTIVLLKYVVSCMKDGGCRKISDVDVLSKYLRAEEMSEEKGVPGFIVERGRSRRMNVLEAGDVGRRGLDGCLYLIIRGEN